MVKCWNTLSGWWQWTHVRDWGTYANNNWYMHQEHQHMIPNVRYPRVQWATLYCIPTYFCLLACLYTLISCIYYISWSSVYTMPVYALASNTLHYTGARLETRVTNLGSTTLNHWAKMTTRYANICCQMCIQALLTTPTCMTLKPLTMHIHVYVHTCISL
jgi:hypothetical protein